MPSGVTTAMPRCTPDTVPRSTKTTLELDPAPVAMMRGSHAFWTAVCCWKTWQRLGAVGGAQLVFEEDVLHLHAGPAPSRRRRFSSIGIVQQDVVAQEADAAAAQPFDDAGQRE